MERLRLNKVDTKPQKPKTSKGAKLASLLSPLLLFGVHTEANKPSFVASETATGYTNPSLEKITHGFDGSQANRESGSPSVSADGRYISFFSEASNLVPNDTNNATDVFVYDRQTKIITRVSVGSNGQQGNQGSELSEISGDGESVAFRSYATNLINSNPEEPSQGIFRHDLDNFTTTQISELNQNGDFTTLSFDGQFVSFGVLVYHTVYKYRPVFYDMFVKNTLNNEVSLVSQSTDGLPGNAGSYGSDRGHFITYDGRLVIYTSDSDNLVSGDINNASDIFLRDTVLNTNKILSTSDSGVLGNDGSVYPVISGDGKFAAFTSRANNLDEQHLGSGSSMRIYLKDIDNHKTTFISRSFQSMPLGDCVVWAISGDGRYTIFSGTAGGSYIYDRLSDVTKQMGVTVNGVFLNTAGSISADANIVAVTSETALVPDDTNGYADIYVYDRSLEGRFLKLPVHDSDSTFAELALGNVGGRGPGRVNSWFDHDTPDYSKNKIVSLWNGAVFAGTGTIYTGTVSASGCATGQNCYDGHNGIDLQPKSASEQAFPAAPGTVVKVVNNCTLGNKTCGDSLGNQVWIDHGNGYATVYGHLKNVDVSNGQNITDLTQPLGIIGSTGNSTGAHLHFEVRFHQDQNGGWSSSEVVDPYGWQGNVADPWSMSSTYLWSENLWNTTLVDTQGGNIQSPSGKVNVTIPAGLFGTPSTIELWDTAVEAAAFGSLRSLGTAFWLNFMNWTGGGNSLRAPAESITLTVNYDDSQLTHLNESQVVIYKLNEASNTWGALSTTVNSLNNTLTAQTDSDGRFELRAPLLCPDTNEVNDNYSATTYLQLDESITGTLDTENDEDWYEINLEALSKYEVSTDDLAQGVDASIEIFDLDGTTILASVENSAEGINTSINFIPSTAGTYFIKVKKIGGGETGCASTYDMNVKLSTQLNSTEVFLPTVLKY